MTKKVDPFAEFMELIAPAMETVNKILKLKIGMVDVAKRLGAAQTAKEGITFDAEEVDQLATLVYLLSKKAE